jgi:hypothetical protein
MPRLKKMLGRLHAAAFKHRHNVTMVFLCHCKLISRVSTCHSSVAEEGFSLNVVLTALVVMYGKGVKFGPHLYVFRDEINTENTEIYFKKNCR